MIDITRYDPLVESVSAVVRCGATPDGQYVKYKDHVAEIERLRAEVEALRADAERYRWLRGWSGIHGSDGIYVANGWAGVEEPRILSGVDLDADIDAALAKEPKP